MASDCIQLSPTDNIAVLTRSVGAEDAVRIGDATFSFPQALGLGHKIACRAIQPGEKILKYGAPIGSATQAIQVGEHVHLHNMKSDYLPTYTLEAGREFHATP